jgi:cytochrome c oxidase assembly factor CtaG
MTHLFLPSFAVLPPLAGDQFLRADLDPAPIAVLVCGLALYLWGVVRQNRLHPRHPWPARRTAAFVGSAVVSAAAVVSFLGAYDRTLFWDHMVQHLLLIMVAAILLAASSPVDLLWRATAGPAHRRVTGWLRARPARAAGHPVTAFVLYGLAVPVAHLTVLFDWAIEYQAVDQLEHLLFLATGYLFWRQVFGVDPNRHRMQPPMRALLLFLAVPVDTFVGLTLSLETNEIFPAFASERRTWGPSLVMDLHVGGVVMWVGGDVLMMLALIPVVVAWVRREERRATRFDRELEAYFPEQLPGGQPTAGFALGRHRPRSARMVETPSATPGAPSPSPRSGVPRAPDRSTSFGPDPAGPVAGG